MTIYIPYFYIIKHIPSGKLYAGSKYAKDANPYTLLKENGYSTSSKIINKLIKQDGLDSFEILRIDTYCDGLHPFNYETLFLETNDCAKSLDWFNGHNNSNQPPAYGTEEFYKLMILKFDTRFPQSNIEIKEKIKSTCLEKYGTPNPIGNKYIQVKSIKTCLLKYGVTHPNKRSSEKERLSNNAKILNKTPHMIEILAYRNKYNNPSKLPENILKASLRLSKQNIESYANGTHPMQTEENKRSASERMKNTMSEEPDWICPICKKIGRGKSNAIRWHFDNCKFNLENLHK